MNCQTSPTHSPPSVVCLNPVAGDKKNNGPLICDSGAAKVREDVVIISFIPGHRRKHD